MTHTTFNTQRSMALTQLYRELMPQSRRAIMPADYYSGTISGEAFDSLKADVVVAAKRLGFGQQHITDRMIMDALIDTEQGILYGPEKLVRSAGRKVYRSLVWNMMPTGHRRESRAPITRTFTRADMAGKEDGLMLELSCRDVTIDVVRSWNNADTQRYPDALRQIAPDQTPVVDKHRCLWFVPTAELDGIDL